MGLVVTVQRNLVERDDLPVEVRAHDPAAMRPRRERRRTVADDLYKRMMEHHESFWSVVYPPFIASGSGSRLTDVDGHEYVDYLIGSGPMLVGHAHPEVIKAIVDAPFSHNIACGLRQLLIGENPLENERLWAKMYRRTMYFGRKGVGITAMAGSTIPEGSRILNESDGLPSLGQLELHIHRGSGKAFEALKKLEDYIEGSFSKTTPPRTNK